MVKKLLVFSYLLFLGGCNVQSDGIEPISVKDYDNKKQLFKALHSAIPIGSNKSDVLNFIVKDSANKIKEEEALGTNYIVTIIDENANHVSNKHTKIVLEFDIETDDLLSIQVCMKDKSKQIVETCYPPQKGEFFQK